MACCKFKSSNQSYAWLKWTTYLKKIFCGAFKYAMLVIGPTMLIFANILIISVALLFILFFIPQLSGDSTILYLFHLSFGLLLLTNIFFNYFMCALTPPGSPSYCPDPGKVLGEKVSIVDGRKIYQISYKLTICPLVNYKYCQHCKCIKPPRAHHDSVTGRCVFNMDHYCPWMANCVGYYNYRYFVSFLLYMSIGCLYVIVSTFFKFHDMSLVDKTYIRMSAVLQTNIFEAVSVSTYCFSLALSAFISVGVLLVWHGYLLLTNQTTIEFYLNLEARQEAFSAGTVFRNPYDEGWRKNLRRLFESSLPWWRHFLPSTHLPPEPRYPFDLEDQEMRQYTRIPV